MSTGGTMQGGRPDQPQQTQTPFMGGYGNQMSQRLGTQSQGLPSGMTGPQFGGSMMPQPAVQSGAPANPLLQGAMGAMGTMGATGPMGPAGAMGQQQLGQQQQVPPWAQQYTDNVMARNSAPPGMSGGMGQMPGQMPIVPPAPTQQPSMGSPRGLNALLSFDDFKQRAMDRIQRDYDHYKQNYDSRMQAGQVPPQRSVYQDDFAPRTPPTGAQTMSGLSSLFSRLGSFR